MTITERKLLWPNTFNTRDFGGHPTQHGQTVAWRQLVRSDNLVRLTAAGQKALIDFGVCTIIDLRFPGELKANPSPFTNLDPENLQPLYQHVSLIPEDFETNPPPMKWKSEAERYSAAIEHFGTRIAAVIKIVANASSGVTLLYCHAGKDRTGIVSAVLLSLLGVAAEDVAADYAASAIHLQPLVEQLRAKIGNDPKARAQLTKSMAADPGTMLEMLNFTERTYGGVEAYLLQSGVTQKEIDAIRDRLLV